MKKNDNELGYWIPIMGYGLYLTNRSLEIMGAAISPTFVLFPPEAINSFLLAVCFLTGFILIGSRKLGDTANAVFALRRNFIGFEVNS